MSTVFGMKSGYNVILYFHLYSKLHCFWRNLHCWQKFYTAAGSDGRDKSHLCCYTVYTVAYEPMLAHTYTQLYHNQPINHWLHQTRWENHLCRGHMGNVVLDRRKRVILGPALSSATILFPTKSFPRENTQTYFFKQSRVAEVSQRQEGRSLKS